jgi:hypothetical protein
MVQSSAYTNHYTSFSGVDVTAHIGDTQIGTIQQIGYNVVREKSSTYVMGRVESVSTARGKRQITGSITFLILDRDALHDIRVNSGAHFHGLNNTFDRVIGRGQDDTFNAPGADATKSQTDIQAMWAKTTRAAYLDEILPIDLTLTFMNEYGNSASQTFYGMEFLTEQMSISIDDTQTQKAVNFTAKSVSEMTPDVVAGDVYPYQQQSSSITW